MTVMKLSHSNCERKVDINHKQEANMRGKWAMIKDVQSLRLNNRCVNYKRMKAERSEQEAQRHILGRTLEQS